MKFENGLITACKFPFKLDLIPKANKTSRSQLKLSGTSITVHNFGDDNKPTAEDVSEYVDNAFDKYVSWHFTIGYYKGLLTIIQELPIDEVGWAAGDGRNGPGNRTSIHIEIEETKEAEKLASEFIKELMITLNINKVVPHKHWSGKNCPRIILPHWNEFIRDIGIMTNEEIQTRLKEEGLYIDKIDGRMGPNSQQALRDFQLQNDLEVTGIANAETCEMLFKDPDVDYKALYEEAQAKLDRIGAIL